MNRDSLLEILPPSTGKEKTIVKDQDVFDIIKEVLAAHDVFAPDYDLICGKFAGGDVTRNLYNFCRQNIDYKVESEDLQTTRSPAVILEMGFCDCKHFAGFIAGILDALNRCGKGYFNWVYRFARYTKDDTVPGHVFVVVKNKDGSETWIDPVLSAYDKRTPEPIAVTDKKKSTMTLVRMSGLIQEVPAIGCNCDRLNAMGNAEDDLLSQVKQYADGITNAIAQAKQTGQLNTIAVGVLQSAGSAVPGLSQALQAVNLARNLISNQFGPGSEASRLFNDISGNVFTILPSVVNTLFNGRTYNTDQYWGAQYYQFYVLGKSNVTNINQISDADVIPALKWFIDRLGVFISGREHIIALTQSPQAYMNYYKANPDTTMDLTRVTAAYQVASRYFIFNGVAGSWAGTVGVFDPALVALAQQLGLSVEQAANEAKQGILPVQVYNPASTNVAQPVPLVSSNTITLPMILIGAGILLAVIGLVDE